MLLLYHARQYLSNVQLLPDAHSAEKALGGIQIQRPRVFNRF